MDELTVVTLLLDTFTYPPVSCRLATLIAPCCSGLLRALYVISIGAATEFIVICVALLLVTTTRTAEQGQDVLVMVIVAVTIAVSIVMLIGSLHVIAAVNCTRSEVIVELYTYRVVGFVT